MASNADHPCKAMDGLLMCQSKSSWPRESSRHGQLRSPLVATKVPACGHAHAGTVDWVCGLCDANVCPP